MGASNDTSKSNSADSDSDEVEVPADATDKPSTLNLSDLLGTW